MGQSKIDVRKHLIPQMKNIVIDTFCASKGLLNKSNRQNHFELFGYDFLVDEDGKVWLIEVNSDPYLGTPNEWTKKIVPEMLDEMFQIVLDPYYPPNKDYLKTSEIKNFELIYAEGKISNPDYLDNSGKKQSKHINHR